MSRTTPSNCSETPTNFESRSSSYTDTMGTCSACLMLAPHSQLFVCLKEDCGYSLQQKVSILSPSLFYRREKVFCGSCAFRGCHSAHSKFMRLAEPLAFKVSSGEVGTKLENELDMFAKLNGETPVDCCMAELAGSKNLDKIQVIKFLESAGTIFEWHRRLSYLHDAMRTLNDFRIQGQVFVKDQAEKLLTAYSNMSKRIQSDTATKSPEKSEIEQHRVIEHRVRMGDELSNESDYSSFSSLSSSSRKSSIRSVSTTSTVLQNFPISQRGQAEVLSDMDNEVTGGCYSHETYEYRMKSRKSTDTALGIFYDIARHFDAIRRFSTLDQAIKQIAEILEASNETIETKQEVAERMEQHFNFKWPCHIR